MQKVELEDIENEIQFMIEEYLETSLHLYSNTDFKYIMLNELIQYFEIQSINQGWNFTDLTMDTIKLEEYIFNCMRYTFLYYQIPPRENMENEKSMNIFPIVENNLLCFGEKNTFSQRTLEWYQYRYNRFSASTIWKLLDSPSNFNSLIFEKCKPFEQSIHKNIVSNEYNPRNWGVKYEQVSSMIYSFKHPKTILKTDYGCIPHSKYSFLCASPDGINISPDCTEKYGCMIEIKNIFNREITGIPLEEYWIQMQIQMETCNLEECDFIETRIKEYENEDLFYLDQIPEFKGLILFFLSKHKDIENKFEYMPLYISLEKYSIEQWIKEIQQKNETDYILYDRSYWYLDEYSCVNVKRNVAWFESIIDILENAWKIVEFERKNGYLHRAPRSKKINAESNSSTLKVVKLEG
jgi:hypothetical protein